MRLLLNRGRYFSLRNIRAVMLLFILIFNITDNISAQQAATPRLNYIPESPTSSNFSRYGDIPIDISTGVPKIEIPIYTLKSGSLEVPINVSYHASGVKVRDVSSEVGIGWVLNCGGKIVREVQGKPDDHHDSPNTSFRSVAEFNESLRKATQTDPTNYNFCRDLRTNKEIKDKYSDRFFYQLPGGVSGVFREDYISKQIKLMPYKPFIITIDRSTYQNSLLQDIKIVDDNGIKYIFKRENGSADMSSWWLKKIVSADNRDSVVFHGRVKYTNYNSFNDILEFGDPNLGNIYERNYALIYPYLSCPNRLKIERFNFDALGQDKSSGSECQIILDSIVCSTGVVKFKYANDRTDVYKNPFWHTNHRLIKCEIFNSLGDKIEDFDFYQSTYQDRMLLDSIGNGEKRHRFSYEKNVVVPAYPSPKDWGTKMFKEDFWGYSNGSATVSLVPEFNKIWSVNSVFNGITKYPSELDAQMLILKEIKYPTGGYTKFEYELNKVDPRVYAFNSTDKPSDGRIGGLRVKKILTADRLGSTPVLKSYLYQADFQLGWGEINPDLYRFRQDFYNFYADNSNGGICRTGDFSGTNACSALPFSPIIGTGGVPVVYNKVEEIYGDLNKNHGKVVYFYELPPIGYLSSDPSLESRYTFDRGIYVPKLLRKEEYSYELDSFKLIRNTSFKYGDFKYEVFHTGMNLGYNLGFLDYSSLSGGPEIFEYYLNLFGAGSLNSGDGYLSTIFISDTKGVSTVSSVISESITEFYQKGDSSNYTVQYKYNDFLQLTEKVWTRSDGKKSKLVLAHPFELKTQVPYDKMISLNNLTPIIKEDLYDESTAGPKLLKSTMNEYETWNQDNFQIYLEKIKVKDRDNALYRSIFEISSYDNKGNVESFVGADGLRKSYLWAINKTLPIAEIVNASLIDVAYTDFEHNNTGNWVWSGAHVAPQGMDDGNALIFPSNRGQISKGGLDPNKQYRVQMWFLHDSWTTGIGEGFNALRSIGKWTLYERIITGLSTYTYSNLNCAIDNISICPVEAQMTTYAYKPLVGMTSKTDARGVTEYYKYDGMQRLQAILDQMKNVTKSFNYHYRSH